MVLEVLSPFMNHVDQAIGIDGHVMRGLPGERLRQLDEIVLDLELVISFPQDDFGIGLLRRDDGRGHKRCRRTSRHGGDETSPADGGKLAGGALRSGRSRGHLQFIREGGIQVGGDAP